MEWLKRLRLISLRALAPRICLFLVLAIGVFWLGGCGSLAGCFAPKTLSELTPETLEGAYVEDDIPFLHLLYAREEEYQDGTSTGKILGARYAIDFGEDSYMGLCVHSSDLARASNMMDACQVYLYGEMSRDRLPTLHVSGTVRAMEGDELDCYMALAGESEALAASLLPYYIDMGRVGGRTIEGQMLLALTALGFLLLALAPAVRALSGAYQRQVLSTISQAWSRSIAAERAGQFYDRTQPVSGVRMGTEFIFFQQGPKSILLHPWDVAWVYQDILHRRLRNDTEAIFLRTMDGRKYVLPMEAESAAALLEAMQEALPGAAFGCSEETERLYRQDRASFSARWEEVRKTKPAEPLNPPDAE